MKYCIAILLLALFAIAMAQRPQAEKEPTSDDTRSKRTIIGGYAAHPYSYGYPYGYHGYPYYNGYHGYYPYAYRGYHGYPYRYGGYYGGYYG